MRDVGLSSTDIEGKSPRDLVPDAIVDSTPGSMDETLHPTAQTDERADRGEQFETQTMPIRDDTGDIIDGMAVSQHTTQTVEQGGQRERQTERVAGFAGDLGHDRRDPMGVAEAELELAQWEWDSSHPHGIAEALDRSQTLVDDVLSLARGAPALERTEPASLSGLAQESWEMILTRRPR